MSSKRETTEAIREALVAHINTHHEPGEGDVVTDLVVVAGWINIHGDEQGSGVHIVSAEGTPSYTAHGLLATASGAFAASRDEDTP